MQLDQVIHTINLKRRLDQVIYTINFLTLDDQECTPAQKHFAGQKNRLIDVQSDVMVMWKDPKTGNWYGPVKLLTWGRGYASVFPEHAGELVWVPERNIRSCQHTDQRDRDPEHQRKNWSEK